MNPPTGSDLNASAPARKRRTHTNNLPVTSPPTNQETAAKTTLNGAELDAIVGKSKRLGPGQSVPNRYPGNNHGAAIRRVRKAAHTRGSAVLPGVRRKAAIRPCAADSEDI